MSDSPHMQIREAIEEQLRQEFQEAKNVYDSATTQYQQAVRRCEELGRAAQLGKQRPASMDSGVTVSRAIKA